MRTKRDLTIKTPGERFDRQSMIEFVPGARTEEGEESKEENIGRFQTIHSPVHKRPLCDKREPERERTE